MKKTPGWGEWFYNKLQFTSSPDKLKPASDLAQKPNFVLSGPGAANYSRSVSELPSDFHQKVMDYEIKLSIHRKDQSDDSYA